MTFNEVIATLVTLGDWLEENRPPAEEFESETSQLLFTAIDSINDAICALEAMLKTTL
jgi:hypothetical protein